MTISEGNHMPSGLTRRRDLQRSAVRAAGRYLMTHNPKPLPHAVGERVVVKGNGIEAEVMLCNEFYGSYQYRLRVRDIELEDFYTHNQLVAADD